MLDEGTARRTGPQLAAELEGRGGALACFADWNAARLRLQMLASDLSYGVDLLAELLHEPVFPPHGARPLASADACRVEAARGSAGSAR